MPYTNYYDNVQTITTPVGGQAYAMAYPGAVCPQSADFGRVHGTAAARGNVTVGGVVLLPVAQEVVIQIGQSAYYGIAIKGAISGGAAQAASTTFSMVDFRDRLHDYNHFAQYNMVDNTGTWWHILPADWTSQRRTFVKKLQSISDFTETQTLPDYNLDNLTDCPPLLSAYTILKSLALKYNFTLSFATQTESKLKSSKPENIDCNRGMRVSELIETILSRYDMSLTAWGNLVIHVTDNGVPSNQFERALMSGNVDLCSFGSYIESELGSDLNERGRRVVVVGGRDQHEYWYPCLPDWNMNFTSEICNDRGYEFSALLGSLGLTRINKLSDMPPNWQDDKKQNGKPRNLMTIGDYIEQVCFKVYRADFGTTLIKPNANTEEIFGTVDSTGKITGLFDWQSWLDQRTEDIVRMKSEETEDDNDAAEATEDDDDLPGEGDTDEDLNDATEAAEDADDLNQPTPIDSVWPISSNLCTDSALQSYLFSHSRKIGAKGQRDIETFINGVMAYLMDGTSLEIEEYITTDKQVNHCNDMYRVRVHFSGQCYSGTGAYVEDPPGKKNLVLTIKPGRVYLRISQDRELFSYTTGASQSSPRSREIIKDFPELKRNYVDGVEQPLITMNFVDAGFINSILPLPIAQEIAARALFHEFLTTAGHVTFRTNAGFMPSGVIESVKVTFSGTTGIRETINFTNTYNDNRIPNFFPTPRQTGIKGEDRVALDRQQQEAKRILAEKPMRIGGVIPREEARLDPAMMASSFGNTDSVANVAVPYSRYQQIEYDIGDIMVVGESGTES